SRAVGFEADEEKVDQSRFRLDRLRDAHTDGAAVHVAASSNAAQCGADEHLEGDECRDRVAGQAEHQRAAESAEGERAAGPHAHAPEVELEAEALEDVPYEVV